MQRQTLGSAVIFTVALTMMPGQASSHREAPLLTMDLMADNTDVYAFVSPDEPDKVTLISNFIPFQKPDGGPNFYPSDPNVVYEIHVDNSGDAVDDITYQWRFTTEVRNPATFLYNTGPVTTLDDPDLNVRQFYRLTRIDGPSTHGFNVSSLAIQIPKLDPASAVGTRRRRAARVRARDGDVSKSPGGEWRAGTREGVRWRSLSCAADAAIRLARTPTSDVAITIGDLSAALGDHAGDDAYFRMAERIERAVWSSGARQPQTRVKVLCRARPLCF